MEASTFWNGAVFMDKDVLYLGKKFMDKEV